MLAAVCSEAGSPPPTTELDEDDLTVLHDHGYTIYTDPTEMSSDLDSSGITIPTVSASTSTRPMLAATTMVEQSGTSSIISASTNTGTSYVHSTASYSKNSSGSATRIMPHHKKIRNRQAKFESNLASYDRSVEMLTTPPQIQTAALGYSSTSCRSGG